MLSHECKYDWHTYCEDKKCSCQCHPEPDTISMREALRMARPKWYQKFFWWTGEKDM